MEKGLKAKFALVGIIVLGIIVGFSLWTHRADNINIHKKDKHSLNKIRFVFDLGSTTCAAFFCVYIFVIKKTTSDKYHFCAKDKLYLQ